MFGKIASSFFTAARQIGPVFLEKQIHTASQGYVTNSLCSPVANSTAGGSWSLIPVRNKMRWHFPYPREVKRIKLHGWAARMSTPNGRKIIMRRILKGRFVLSH